MTRKWKALAHSAALASAAMAPAVLAQTTAAPAGNDSATNNGLEEITVTARRTNENLQRVPVAASVLSGEALSKQGITTTRELQFNVPSLVITPDPLGGSSTPTLQLRGQTSPLGTDNTVVTYFGDVPVDARVVAAGVFDLASVQVLRGPQGTLFGKNSTGGAVVYTPQKAEADEVKGFAEGQYGNYNLRQITGAVNLPLVKDVLAVRLSGQIARQDGMVKNISGPDGNNKHWDAGRIAVNFTPGSVFENQTLFTYFKGRQRINPSLFLEIYGVSFFIPPTVAAYALQQQLGKRKFSMSEATAPNSDNNRSYLISNISSVDLGSVVFKNIFGYSDTKLSLRQNQPAIDVHTIDVAQNRNLHQISDEIQLSGSSESLKWIVGGFYSKQVNDVIQRSRIFSPVVNSKSDSSEKYNSKALFGQATYDFASLGLDGLKFTAGLRHTWDKRIGSNVQNVPIPISDKRKNWSWTVGLDYQATDQVLLYVASRHSYKAGGFNLISPLLPASSLLYKPEKLTDVEIGAKAQATVGSIPVRANLALYRGWYKDIHTQATGICGGSLSGQASLIVNAGKGTPKGVELELEARLTPNLQVSGFYNRTLGKYDKFIVPAVPGCVISAIPDLTGANFGNISKDTFGLNASYTLPLSRDREELQLSGNMYSRSGRLGNGLEQFNSSMPGYTIFNARLDYNHIAGSDFGIGVFVRNIGDRTYGVSRNVSRAAGYGVWQFGDPRTYGVVGRVDF